MQKITPISILEIGEWYETFLKTGRIEKYPDKIFVTDTLDGKINGYDPRINILKGNFFYHEALEEVFKMIGGYTEYRS